MSRGPYSKMLAQMNNLRRRDQAGSRGRSRTQDQKTRTVSTCSTNAGGISLIDVASQQVPRDNFCFSVVSKLPCQRAAQRDPFFWGRQVRRYFWRSPRRSGRPSVHSSVCSHKSGKVFSAVSVEYSAWSPSKADSRGNPSLRRVPYNTSRRIHPR